MQNPADEIGAVVSLITAAVSPEIQQAAVLKYYAADAAFKHPLCDVLPGPGSRNRILGILQWYRVLSPTLKVETRQVTYNEAKKQLFVEVVQEFHIRWSPLRVAPARLLVHLTLRESDEDPNLLVIAHHEDFYHPEDMTALLFPPLIPVVRLLLHTGALASNINARIFSLLGFWAVKPDPGPSTSSSGDVQERSKED